MSKSRPSHPANPPLEPVLTTTEVAALLRIHRKRLYRMVERGDAPPSFRVGNDLRFPARDFREWLEERKS